MSRTPLLEVVSRSTVDAAEVIHPLPGFIGSDFSPLLWTVAGRCLSQPGSSLFISGNEARVGIVLSSRTLDSTTLTLAAEQTNAGNLTPILFYQATPTAVLGLIARDHALTGPVSCIAADGDAADEARDVATITLSNKDADALLLLTVDLEAPALHPRATAELVRRRQRSDPTKEAR